MAAKLLSASLSLIWLYLLHCPEAKAASSLFQRLEKAKPAFQCGSGLKCKGSEEQGTGAAPALASSLAVRFYPCIRISRLSSAEPRSLSRSYLIRTGLSPPLARS